MAASRYERLVMATAHANGRVVGHWQLECAIRRDLGRVDQAKLHTALARLQEQGRLARDPDTGPRAIYRVPAGRR